MTFSQTYLEECSKIIDKIDRSKIEDIVNTISELKEIKGRIFFLGVGGSAGNASHAVNDFRKIVGIESYAPTDNVSELTARTNDDGWETIFSEWLKTSKLNKNDLIFILSVGGGNLEKNISPNLVNAVKYAVSVGSKICGIIGKEEGYVNQISKNVLVIPPINHERITPHSEAFQAVIWHLIVSHPKLKQHQTKWESEKK